PSLNATVILPAPSMTCALVRISPEASKMNPDPTPVDGTERGTYALRPADSTVSVTTAGLADSATATTASDEVTVTGVVETLVVVPVPAGVAVARSAAPNPVSSPTVPTDPTTADSIEMASRPASHRP